jgi:hypothetical protein
MSYLLPRTVLAAQKGVDLQQEFMFQCLTQKYKYKYNYINIIHQTNAVCNHRHVVSFKLVKSNILCFFTP